MKTHNVFYFKQRINKDLFEKDVRRINCKVYFSVSLEHIRKSKLLNYCLSFFMPCNMHVIHRKGKENKEPCEPKYFYYVIYIIFI